MDHTTATARSAGASPLWIALIQLQPFTISTHSPSRSSSYEWRFTMFGCRASLCGYSTNMPLDSLNGYYAASAGTSSATQPPSCQVPSAPYHPTPTTVCSLSNKNSAITNTIYQVRPDGTRGLVQPHHGFNGAYADPGSYGRHGAGYPYTPEGHIAARGGYRNAAAPPAFPHPAHLHPEPCSAPPSHPQYGATYGQSRPFKSYSAFR